MSLKEFDDTLSLRAHHNIKTKIPLRYPGGKNNAVKTLARYIPSTTKEMVSPFFGGGSVEMVCANNGIRVYGYDVFEPLVEFWQCAIQDAKKLSRYVQEYYPFDVDRDYSWIREAHGYHPDKWERAAIYFVCNRVSFSGMTFAAASSWTELSLSAISRLANFRVDGGGGGGVSIERMDFTESIPNSREGIFFYCDPPYALETSSSSLYGYNGELHKDFGHDKLADILHTRNNWMLCYNDCEYVRGLYRGYRMRVPTWTYMMTKKKKSNELLIFSDDLKI